MIEMTTMIMIVMALWATQTSSPIKMSMLITFVSLTLFAILTLSTGDSWFPLIYLMLFLGGVLIMFLILSSLLPNEKSIKMKSLIILPLLVLSLPSFNKLSSKTLQTKEMKWFLGSKSNMFLMGLMMTMYFFSFLKILGEKNFSMRCLHCYYL